MKHQIILALLALLTPVFLNAQIDESKPYKVSKAAYYVKTAPLTELVAKVKADKSEAIQEIIEVENELDYNKWSDSDQSIPSAKIQSEMGSFQSRGPLVGFSGQSATGYYPPDTDGDVNEEYFVQMVNSRYNVYQKDGTKILGPLDLGTLWSQLPPGNWGNDGDPIILYDEEAGRWILTQFRVNSSTKYELFAISETSDPTGAYYLYAFSFGTTMNDYPKIGVWNDGYYATYNMFQNGSFTGSRITAVERDKMLIGDPDAQMVQFHKNGYYATMPADIDGEMLPPDGEPCPVMYITNSKTIQLWGLEVDWENTDNSSLNLMNTLIPSNFTAFNGNIIQPNNQNLDALSQMIMNRLAYRKFDDHASMVTNHTVYANGKAGIRWYEMRKEDGGEWELYQEGTYAPDNTVHRWLASTAMNANGDIALAYSVTNNEDVNPSIRYTGRHEGDPLGVMTVEEVELRSGTNSQSGFSRWGDYSCLNVDPENDTVFWFTGEYNGWNTWITSFDLGGIASATASAGEDAFICVNEQYQTQGTGTGVLSIEWTTDGDGFFAPDDEFNSTYIRGSQDVANGGCTLTMTVTGFDGEQISDDMYLNIVPYVNAGEDAAILPNESYQLQAEGTETGTIQWSTSGDGSFSDAHIMQPIYTPGPSDIENAQVTLSVEVAITEPCEDDKSDEMVLDVLVGMDEIKNAQKLSIYPNPTNDIFTINFEGVSFGEEFTYYIYTSYGKEVFREVVRAQSDNYQKTIDLSEFKAGIYFVNIQTDRGNITKKVVKK